MCWFCDDVKKIVNAHIVIYDDTTANVIKEYSYPDSTVTLKITAGGYRGNSHILTGMRELNGLKYCPNCGKKIEGFETVHEEAKEPKRYRDIADLYERLAKGGIECSITVDDKNGICTIYSHGRRVAEREEEI